MKKEFVPYKQALELKELGFDEECFAYYYNKELSFGARVAYGEVIESPLYQQAFRWFREKYDMSHSIDKDWDNGHLLGYEYMISEQEGVTGSKTYPTYEEAELACLKKLIEIVKNF